MRAHARAVIPRRTKNQAAEIQAFVSRIFQREDIGFHIAKGRFRLLDRAMRERVDDPFLEIHFTRMHSDNLLAFGIGEIVVRKTEHIHLHARRDERDDRLLVLRNARRSMQRD